jgi:D-aminoacyl-tRNA deacylase
MATIVISKKCPAGQNVGQHLLKMGFKKNGETFDGSPVYSFKELKLVFVQEMHIYADKVKELDTEQIVFASTHKSQAMQPCLSVHPVGNFGKAELGGWNKTLVPCSARVNKQLIKSLQARAKANKVGWPVTGEVTHHGPFVDKPVAFIEIGSSREQWSNPLAGKTVAEALVQGLSAPAEEFEVALGVGGTHYCPEFTKIMLRTDIALGHIISKHAVDLVDKAMFMQAIKKTKEKVDFVLFDWKGLNAEQRNKIKGFAEAEGLEWRKTRQLL